MADDLQIEREFSYIRSMKEASIRKLISFGLSVILAWVFVMSGWRKIFPSEEIESRFLDYGYDPEFAMQVGIAELIAGFVVVIPAVTSISCLAIIALMVGATYTHINTGIGSPSLSIAMLVLATVLMCLRWPESFLKRLVSGKKT